MVNRPVSDDSVSGAAAPLSRWTRDAASRIRRTERSVAPIVYPPEDVPNRDVHVWDTWLLRDRHGGVAEVDGWQVAFSLTASADLLPGTRHDVATVRYFYSRDGRNWRAGGRVFAEDRAFGQRQWAGSALYDDGDVYLYYTAAGEAEADELRYSQRIAGATGPTLRTDDGGVAFDGQWDHRVLLRPDGDYYETEQQSRAMTYTFRDPWFYEDPETGETCLLFEGNVPVPEGSDACGGDEDHQVYNGCVGVAVSPSGDPMDWELRPPILDGVCVNQELERPHVLHRDGSYYLFVSSHDHTFAPGIDGYDGLYGFVADSLGGPYRPLNDSGLVVTNPANAPFQTYSYMVVPHGEEVLVQNFFNFYDFAGESVDLIGELPEPEQRRRFGGTLGPTVRLGIDGDRTRVLGTLDAWHLPTADEPLPELGPDEPGTTRAVAGDDAGGYGATADGSTDRTDGSD
ncbi:glycoside hydrolase family 68 protein [Halosimplex rubrum]|uniref:Glycoside hydrolase family 68 protein n=1 Tax=Halosimplex rubrum TaxID=869889 RepID=A0A7D5P5P1_9EURY|nr:glycoside hydrolase family 68 protein [Halosimplex rubrum]QLH78305.1 glycoside hydrolase family 68 protein [Halosimplex rubrum]